MSSAANTTQRRWPWLVRMVLAMALAVALSIWWRYDSTYHFAVVQEGALYRDGNHSTRQFEVAAQKAQPKTIVSLVDDEEMTQPQFRAEIDYCKTNGIELVRIPIKAGGWPTSEQVQQFLSVAGDKGRQPVLVHCAQGVRRTGMMTAAYQESVMGFDAARAKDSILSFGHSERTLDDVRKFIDVYDAKARRLTAVPAATSQE